MSQQQHNDMQQHFYRASAADFAKIPGSPVAYWASQNVIDAYANNTPLGVISQPRVGMRTGDNERFLRYWFEVSYSTFNHNSKCASDAKKSQSKWFPFVKGGDFRKWYGNVEQVVNWFDDGLELKTDTLQKYPQLSWDNLGWKISNEGYYFKPAITWSAVSSSYFGVRFVDFGNIFGTGGSCIFPQGDDFHLCAAFLCSKLSSYFLDMVNPTLNINIEDVAAIPVNTNVSNYVLQNSEKCYLSSKQDWNSFERSWNFIKNSLVDSSENNISIYNAFISLQSFWYEQISEVKSLEEENNRFFIDAYGLQDELTPEVPLSEITLTCNPHYRYGGNLTDEEREARLQSDTIAELISYAIGCMMGRYSLDREGLVYAHAGNEGFKALVEEGAYATFTADEDGILPLTADNWFPDDVAARIEQFVRTVWGAETLEENLQFIADSLCLAAIKPVKKGGETARETLRRYLSTQFFKDHMKTYKKRPIYWLFSSGKEKAFECLVYLHRYNESTLPRMRTEYVTPLLGQMTGRIERKRLEQAEADTAQAKRLAKEIETLTKQLAELRAFDDELKHHADMRIQLDLDDGVKVNYGKFGSLLSDVKAITGDKGGD
ncbi:BREX-1 system adenine-specific DNA-methyltransferase PglX [Aeromonas sanarellii]